jgi:membrane associated rhomboid family serine protease
MNSRQSNPFLQIASLIALLFLIHALNVLTGMWLVQFGVIPRSLIGLRGVLFSPLLHGNWAHLMANTVPLAVMLGLLSLTRTHPLWTTTAQIWTLSGLAVWVVGRPHSVQIGASGLIYGLAAFLITAAWTTRNFRAALGALIVLVVYGGIFWGVFPNKAGVSWEGHLCGALAGFLVAKTTQKNGRLRS